VTPRTRPIIILLFGFVLLGMPSAVLGVAWPSMAEELDRGLGDLGMITIAMGASYGLVSFGIGSLTKRFPAGRLVVGAAVAAAVSLMVLGVSDVWWVILVAAVPLGFSGGAIDSVGNAFVAVRHGPRAMGGIHAAFGLGSMIAPLFMTVLFALGLPWRIGFVVLAILEVVLAVAFAVVAGSVRMPMEGSRDRPRRLGRRRLLGMSVWAFFIYAGVEGSTGLWAFTLLTEGQGMSDNVAGLSVAAYWGALFLARLVIGVVGDRFPLDSTLSASVIAVVVGLGLMWWNPVSWVSVLGLIVAGFANGPVFPFEVLLTARRFGTEFTPWAVGYQLSAATVSIALVPAMIGVAVNLNGAIVIAPLLTVLAVVMAISVEILRLLSHRDVEGRESTASS
jgi:fucose permease